MMVSFFHLTWLLIFSIQLITTHSVSCNNAPEIENCETECEPFPRCKSHERDGVIDPVTNAKKPATKCGLENQQKKKECGTHFNDKEIIQLEFAAAVQCSDPDNPEQDLCYEQKDAEDDFNQIDPTLFPRRTIVKKQTISAFARTRRLVRGQNSHGVSKSEIWKTATAPEQFRRYFILNAVQSTINEHNTAIINAIKQSRWFIHGLVANADLTYAENIAGYNRMHMGPGSEQEHQFDAVLRLFITRTNDNWKSAFLYHVATEFKDANPGKFIRLTHHRYMQDHIYNRLATEYPHLIITEDGFKQDAARAPVPVAPRVAVPGHPILRNSFSQMAQEMAEEARNEGHIAPGHVTPGGPIAPPGSGTPGGPIAPGGSGTPGGPILSQADLNYISRVLQGDSGRGTDVAHQSYFNKLPGQFTEEKYDYDRGSAPIFDLKFYLWSILLIGMCSCCICVVLMCFLGGISIGWIGKNFVDNKSDVISIECSEV